MDTILATRQEEEKSDETFIAEAVDSINEMTGNRMTVLSKYIYIII